MFSVTRAGLAPLCLAWACSTASPPTSTPTRPLLRAIPPAKRPEQAERPTAIERRRLALPPAPAALLRDRVVVVPFSAEEERASYIAAIHGNQQHVWLLANEPQAKGQFPDLASLYWSDGQRLRRVDRSICVKPEGSFSGPEFRTLRVRDDGVELLGTTVGSLGRSPASARRSKKGAWLCEESAFGQYWGIDRFWSAGELTTVYSTPVGLKFAFGGSALSTEPGLLEGKGADPIAVSKGGVHAWALAWQDDTHWVEWTGLRWREREDALPEFVYAEDIAALTVDEDGHYYAATPYCLLSYDGSRFVAHPVPQGFQPERLVVSSAYGLWALGPHRAWHLQNGAWSQAELPMAHVNAEWVAPNGILWIAGSSLANVGWSQGELKDATVVKLTLSARKGKP